MKKKAVFTAVAGSIIALLLTAVLVVGLSTEGFGVRSALQERDSAGMHLTKSVRYLRIYMGSCGR